MAFDARRMRWTEAEYSAMENESPVKHEYLDGEVVAMAGAGPLHNQVAGRALLALGRNAGRCEIFTSDQRIHVPATGLSTYSDGGLACGRWAIHHDGMCLLNPVVLLEVLSPSTAGVARGSGGRTMEI